MNFHDSKGKYEKTPKLYSKIKVSTENIHFASRYQIINNLFDKEIKYFKKQDKK